MAKPKPRCTHCEKATVRLHPILDIPLCRGCEKAKPELYKYVTATTARKGYRLKESDLEVLGRLYVKNPYYRSAAPMRLYLLNQVRDLVTSEGCVG